MMDMEAAREFCCKFLRTRGAHQRCTCIWPLKKRSIRSMTGWFQGRKSITHRCKITLSWLPERWSLQQCLWRLQGHGLPAVPCPRCFPWCSIRSLVLIRLCPHWLHSPREVTFFVPWFSHVLQSAPRSAGESDAAMH